MADNFASSGVDSKDSPPSCSFSPLKELGPIHTGQKCQMEQEISGISKFPERRTTSRGESKFSKWISGKFLFHSILTRNFWKFWLNGTCPLMTTYKKDWREWLNTKKIIHPLLSTPSSTKSGEGRGCNSFNQWETGKYFEWIINVFIVNK